MGTVRKCSRSTLLSRRCSPPTLYYDYPYVFRRRASCRHLNAMAAPQPPTLMPYAMPPLHMQQQHPVQHPIQHQPFCNVVKQQQQHRQLSPHRQDGDNNNDNDECAKGVEHTACCNKEREMKREILKLKKALRFVLTRFCVIENRLEIMEGKKNGDLNTTGSDTSVASDKNLEGRRGKNTRNDPADRSKRLRRDYEEFLKNTKRYATRPRDKEERPKKLKQVFHLGDKRKLRCDCFV